MRTISEGGFTLKYPFALCEGRHPIPGVEAAIFPMSVDPTDLNGMMEIASSSVPSDCTELTVYVTGLTVAMLTVVNLCLDREIILTAMHFNRETGEYYPQSILEYSRCGFCSGKLESRNHYCPNCGAN